MNIIFLSKIQTYILFYTLILLCCALIFFSEKLEDKYKNLKITLFVIAFLFSFIILGFRNVGFDTGGNQSFFYTSKQALIHYNGFPEIGYLLLNFLIYIFGGNFNTVKVIVAFISLCLIFIAIYRFRKHGSMALMTLIFFGTVYFYFFGTMRMSIAIGFVYNAIDYLLDRNKRKFYIFTIIGCCFHYSALMILIIPLFMKLYDRYIKSIKSVLIVLIVFFALMKLMPYFKAPLSSIPFIYRYIDYFIPKFNLPNIKNYIYVFPFLAMYYVSLLYSKSRYDKNRSIISFLTFLSIVCIFYPVFRFIFYFVPVLSLSLTYVMDTFEQRIYTWRFYYILVTVISVITLLYLFVSIFNSFYLGRNFIPYSIHF